MSTIYRKTAQGLEEIERRTRSLPPRLRSALILVDGKRDDGELRKLVPAQADEALQALLDQGLIEAVASAPPAPPKAGVRSSEAAAAATGAGAGFDQLRRDAVRKLNDLLGPTGESLAMKMERAASASELRPLVEAAAAVIRNVRGAQTATEYAQRFAPAP